MKTPATFTKHAPVRRYILISLIVLALTGCMSSAGKQYYQLFLPIDSANAAVQEGNEITPAIDKVVLLEPVGLEDIYNDYRVVYRSSPYEVNYYSYRYWIKKPGKMVQDSMRDYFSGNHIFKRVITGYSQGEPELLIKAFVRIIEEIDRPGVWYGHLAMNFEVKDFKSGKILMTHSFDRQERLIQKKVGQLPIVISKILESELDLLIEKIKKIKN